LAWTRSTRKRKSTTEGDWRLSNRLTMSWRNWARNRPAKQRLHLLHHLLRLLPRQALRKSQPKLNAMLWLWAPFTSDLTANNISRSERCPNQQQIGATWRLTNRLRRGVIRRLKNRQRHHFNPSPTPAS